jgi:hypothetical protein
MEKDLFKILKELKQIQPDSDYSRQSRLLILNSNRPEILVKSPELRRNRFADVLAFNPARLALALGVFVIFIIGTVYYVNSQLNQNNLVVKAGEMNDSIQIKLNEIKYLLENKPVTSENISTVQVMLGKAIDELKEASNFDGDLDNSLEKIKSAQEIFSQIDTLLKIQN